MHDHGVIHRDMKPANVMLCDDGTLRIMDFGIAKTEAMRRITFGGFSPTMGTPDYMAPEQIKGKRGDQRTDIYSLGAILYEMLTGPGSLPGPERLCGHERAAGRRSSGAARHQSGNFAAG